MCDPTLTVLTRCLIVPVTRKAICDAGLTGLTGLTGFPRAGECMCVV